MNPTSRSLLLGLVAVLLVAGCASTPSDRFAESKAVAAAWPAEVQAKVQQGIVEPGFTMDQVRVALGKADRVYTRQSEQGSFEIWAYLSKAPSISLGIGGGGGNFGAGASISSRQHEDERKRVIFKDGLVVSIETTKRG